jgi:hypothetical protein
MTKIMSVSKVIFPDEKSLEQFFVVGAEAESCRDEKEAEKRAKEMTKFAPKNEVSIYRVIISLKKVVKSHRYK